MTNYDRKVFIIQNGEIVEKPESEVLRFNMGSYKKHAYKYDYLRSEKGYTPDQLRNEYELTAENGEPEIFDSKEEAMEVLNELNGDADIKVTAKDVGGYTIYAIQSDFRDWWCGRAWDWFTSIANDDYALTGNHKPAEGQSKAEYFEECKTKVYNDAGHCDSWIEFNDKDDAIEWLEGELECSTGERAELIKNCIQNLRDQQ